MHWDKKRLEHKKFGFGICIADTVGDTMLVKFDIKPSSNDGIHLCNPNDKDYEYLRWVVKKDCKHIK